MVEMAIGILMGRIKRKGLGKPWPVILSRVEQAYNASWHSVIKAASKTVMLGVKPNVLHLTEKERRQSVESAASNGDESWKRQRVKEISVLPLERH